VYKTRKDASTKTARSTGTEVIQNGKVLGPMQEGACITRERRERVKGTCPNRGHKYGKRKELQREQEKKGRLEKNIRSTEYIPGSGRKRKSSKNHRSAVSRLMMKYSGIKVGIV